MTTRYREALTAVERALQRRLEATVGADPGSTPTVALSPARDPAHGDFATAAALAAGKLWKRNPLEVAQSVIASGVKGLTGVATIDVKAPGFINLRMAPAFWGDVVAEIVALGAAYGKSDALKSDGPILLEFVSANPTGPLNVVQGRSSSIGATLAACLRFGGATVSTETYVNDAGTQLDLLADTLFARYATLCGVPTPLPEDGYQGDYLVDAAERLRARDGDKWLHAPIEERRRTLRTFGRDTIVDQQRADLEYFRVRFDRWFSEASLHESGAVDDVLEDLKRRGVTYEQEGALWLRSTQFGDDKDRVLRRSDGRPTYIASDAAYHRDKLARGNKRLIDIWGPDHHGYITRLNAIVSALGAPGSLEVLTAQQVTLKRAGEVVAMSKRAGNIVTLREVLDEVGVDAARFFFCMRALESPLVFDLGLAVAQSADNPVYYVQYGHARIASILRKAAETGREALLERAQASRDIAKLAQPSELALVRRLADFPRTVVDAAKARAPHRLAEYARDVATDFHGFYTECIVLSDDEALTSARLSLCIATRTIIASALDLLGVLAPEKM
ncbi:MAG TPA: arginine--tRNA ligase [Candidatus Tumulicola sp.]|nr:arginine--tRNA ligase [Candidatus Tumulicola sp.]